MCEEKTYEGFKCLEKIKNIGYGQLGRQEKKQLNEFCIKNNKRIVINNSKLCGFMGDV